MTAFWHLQRDADVPPGERWMTSAERERLAAFPAEKRRRDWRLGRWTAKRLLALLDGLAATEPDLSRYEVWPAPSGVPVAHREGRALASPISLSHSHGVAVVVAGSDGPGGGPVGCDLERVEPRVRGFEEDYLTDAERGHLRASSCSDPVLATTLFWTAKESVMKALGEGLRLPVKSVEIAPGEELAIGRRSVRLLQGMLSGVRARRTLGSARGAGPRPGDPRGFGRTPSSSDPHAPRERPMSLDRYCSACAAPLPHAAPVTCPACGAAHWRDPKPCAGALVERDGKALLVRRARDPWRGHWDVPGGYCELQEHPAATAIREVREEVGLEVEITGYLGAWTDVYGPPGSADAEKATLNLYYTARIVGGEEGTGDPTETLEIGWFAPQDVPETLAFPAHIAPVVDAWRRVIASRITLQPLLDFAGFDDDPDPS